MDTSNGTRQIFHHGEQEETQATSRRSLRSRGLMTSEPQDLTRPHAGHGTKERSQRPKKLTACRTEELQAFLKDTITNPSKYAHMDEETWMNEFIQQLKKRNSRSGKISTFDVSHWLQNSKFDEYFEPVNAEINPQAITDAPLPGVKMEVERADESPEVPAEYQFPHLSEQEEMSWSAPFPVPNIDGLKTEVFSESLNSNPHPLSFSFPGSSSTNNMESFIPVTQPEQVEPNFPPEVDVFVQSGGFIITIPPCETHTTFLIEPKTWKAYKCPPHLENQGLPLEPQDVMKMELSEFPQHDVHMGWPDELMEEIKQETPEPIPEPTESLDEPSMESWHPLSDIPEDLSYSEYLTHCAIRVNDGY